jgi:hypothetical protein
MRPEECRFCNEWAMQQGEQTIGTASSYDRFLMVEVPTPWAPKIAESRGMPPGLVPVLLRAGEAGLSLRFQAIVPDPAWRKDGQTRVILFALARTGPFTIGYRRSEFILPTDQVAALVEALLFAPEGAPAFASFAVDPGPVRDLFVCTHGSQDAACGRYGYPLYEQIRCAYADGQRLRVWRTSHTGGHRFAATLLDFPDGLSWGHIQAADLPALIERTAPPAALAGRYRGNLALRTHWEQHVERAALLEIGWDWLRWAKRGEVLAMDEAAGWARVRIDWQDPTGVSGAFAGVVARGAAIPSQPSTRGPIRMQLQYDLTEFVRLAGA